MFFAYSKANLYLKVYLLGIILDAATAAARSSAMYLNHVDALWHNQASNELILIIRHSSLNQFRLNSAQHLRRSFFRPFVI